MNRYRSYLAEYRADRDTRTELLAFTGEELAHAIARLADAAEPELTDAALYTLEIAADHCSELARAAMPDQAAASMIGLLFMLLHRRVNPDTLGEPYCNALVDIVFNALAAAQRAEAEGDTFARDHWTAIVLQQVALAAATLRALAPDTNGEKASKILRLASHAPSIPTTWPPTITASHTNPGTPTSTGTPITPQRAIDILGDSTSRLLALNLLA